MGSTLRFAGIVVVLFLAVFFGGRWLFEVRPLKPDGRLPTFQRVNPDDPRVKLEKSSISDDDPTRDRLRKDVLEWAKPLKDDPCNKTLRAHYVKAATDYALAWISIAPCLGTQTCGSWDSSLTERARHACGSPLDLRVRDAMQAVHAKGIFGPADFPKETIHLLAALAARHAKARLDNMPQRVDCGR